MHVMPPREMHDLRVATDADGLNKQRGCGGRTQAAATIDVGGSVKDLGEV